MKFNIRFKSEKSLEKILTYIGWVIFAIHMVIANAFICAIVFGISTAYGVEVMFNNGLFIACSLGIAAAEWLAYFLANWIGEDFVDISFSILAKYCEDEEADEIFIDNPEVI